MTISETLADFITTMEFKRLPESVVECAKKVILDHIGVAAVGSATPWGAAVSNVAYKSGGAAESGIYFSNRRVPAGKAALVNGTYGHGFEFDDHCMTVHPGCVVTPAALAMSERQGAIDGRMLITAIVLGYEVLIRVAAAMGSISRTGHHTTGTMGAIGSATATGKLLGLAKPQVVWALGLAGNFPTGVCEFHHGSMEKRVFAGRASESGILAGLLAEEGFVGPSTIFEGEFGFCHAFSRKVNLDRLTEGLGTRYYIEEINIKRFPCAGRIHSFIDGALELRECHPEVFHRPESVEQIIIESGDRVLDPRRTEVEIQDVMGAQYSIPYGVAVTLAYGRPGARAFSEEVIRSSQVQTLLGRCRVVKHDGFPREGRITVTAKDGRTVSLEFDENRKPLLELDKSVIVNKLMEGAVPLLGFDRVEQMIEAVDHLESLADVRELTRLLTLTSGSI